MANIEKSIQHLAVDLNTLVPLPGNPRKGNIDAISASYREFGQVRPIVIRPNGDGTSTVIAGNHQVEAAKRLGWSQIAAVSYDADDERAVAFALADNRTNELGHTDPELLQDMIIDVGSEYVDLLEGLGWDEFELAALDEQTDRLKSSSHDGYVAPVIVDPDFGVTSTPDNSTQSPIAIERSDEGNRIVASGDVDSKSVAAMGSTTINASGSSKAVVQYTLVFDDPNQQSKWYSFIRWLRMDPGTDGETTAQRLINFIDSHANY